jgi:hypothetical protein
VAAVLRFGLLVAEGDMEGFTPRHRAKYNRNRASRTLEAEA